SRLDSSFFFQAEDGIRDFHVTGVQTCALPIYGLQAAPGPDLGKRDCAPVTLRGADSCRTGGDVMASMKRRLARRVGEESGAELKIGRASCRARGQSRDARGRAQQTRRTGRA